MDLLVPRPGAARTKADARVSKQSEQRGNWIGFRFREAVGKSPVGARVLLRYDGRSSVRQIVTEILAARAHVHFGLGEADRVERGDSNGQTTQCVNPP